MQWCRVRRIGDAPRRKLSRSVSVLAIAALAATAAGCSSLPTDGRSGLASASQPGSISGSTLAFESIDGPPPEVFRKLVANLNDEADARQISVVSRTGAATYRVRGYVSALVERGKTTFAWVWDVYDTDKRRTLRIAGEEPAAATGRGTRNAWAGADEQVLRRMARDGMDRIAGLLNSPGPPVIAPEPSLVTLVSGRDDSPEGAGIFRVFGDKDQPAGSAAVEGADDKPPPKPANGAKSRTKTDIRTDAKTSTKLRSAAATPAASFAHLTEQAPDR